ncbi:dynein axonemal intermediate chain 4 isoform X2 [Hyla sarda]|uniref:dynein axonemal intermediate chain 4 isoform X2 n=1 Tax=Hyla sarda TaxID=327740 RepID=UPI0024C34864|nr:dynein axonemal intermediate chain 4 isoform X2 [Hyla sarda]
MSGPTRTRAQRPGNSVPKMASHVKKIINISGFVTQSRANRSMMGSRRSISLHMDSKILDKNYLSSGKQVIPVFDDEGNDVTPRALFQAEPGAAPSKQAKLFTPPDTSAITASDIFSTMSLQQTGLTASFMGPFSRSTFGGSSMSRSSQEAGSLSEDVEEPVFKRDVGLSLPDFHLKQDDAQELKEEDLDKPINVYLMETDTIWLLDIPSAVISSDDPQAEFINSQNQTYADLCKNRAGNDRYIERTMQTINWAPKSKEVQCETIVLEDAGVMASVWDLYDSYNSPECPPVAKPVVEAASRSESVTSSRSNTSRQTTSVASMDRGDFYSSTITDLDRLSFVPVQDEAEADGKEILQSEKLQQDLFIMERVVVENIFQAKLAAYRQLPVIIDPEAAEDTEVMADVTSPGLDRLWSFVCEVTKGHNVSSTSWNKKNPDLLAVGYGQFGYKEQKGGLACCWSLKNTMWPERIYHCESGVTALDFSASSPHLLAVGMYNGTIAIYNVQNKENVPVLDSSENLNKHTCPVWQVKWIEQDSSLGEDKGECLVSIGADGRITKWHIRKGLDCSDLMRLKRTGKDRLKKSTGDKEKKEAFISRQAPGMCFDFHPTDANIYLAGTEEGHIHKCSCSYNEQFLDTYRAHKGPVYKLAWSPFCPDVFLSCSADWCIHLWRQDILQPVLTFSATTNAVHDIMWSPSSPLVFGAVNENRVEIWDLSVSTLDPVIVSSANPGVKLTTLLFSKNTNCVLIGDSDGQVSVYALRNVSSAEASQVNALYELIEATLASQL